MKIERSRDLQGQRTDRQKQEKTIRVPEGVRPASAREGQQIYDGKHYLIRESGNWVRIGATEAEVEREIEQGVANAPRAARASLIRTVDARVNAGLIDTTEFDQPFEYEVGKNPARTEFRIRWYLTLEAWQDQTPEADVGDAPITIEWLPPTPVETEGIHRGVFRHKLNPNTTGDFNFFGDIDVI